eukprot:529418_1
MIWTFLFGVMTDAVHARFLVLYFNVALTQHNPDTPRSSVSRSRSNSRPHTPITNPNLSVMQENMNANESWVGQHKHLVGSVNLAICTGAFMFLRMLLFIVTRSIDGTKIEVCDRISMDTGVRFFTYFPTIFVSMFIHYNTRDFNDNFNIQAELRSFSIIYRVLLVGGVMFSVFRVGVVANTYLILCYQALFYTTNYLPISFNSKLKDRLGTSE